MLLVRLFLTAGLSVVAAQFNYDAATGTVLQEALATNYSTVQRPEKQTNVTVDFGVSHITSLDIVTQRLSITGFLAVRWDDPRLVWLPMSYSGMTEIFVTRASLWTPPLVLFNAAESVMTLSDDSDTEDIPMKVMNSGTVVWLTPVSWSALCTVDISYYPFDEQECFVEVSSWFYAAHELSVMKNSDDISLDLYEENGEWDLTNTKVTEVTRSLHSFPLPMVRFTMFLSRKYSYYLLNMVLPVIFLAFLGTFVFLLPAESGEKNGFALTILLSLSVVMTIVSDSIPPTSTHVCILSVYLLTTFLLCTMEVLVTVVTLKIGSYDDLGYTMCPGSQALTRQILVRFSRYRRANDETTANAAEKTTKIPPQYHGLPVKKIIGRKDSIKSNVAIILPDNNGFSNQKSCATPPAWVPEDQDTEEHVEDYSYKDVAMMLDKINFVISFFLTSVITTVFMLLLVLH